ncbi:MAG: response regulator transcription factor [Acidimicrobiales bacterium]|nr:response regulator transcription factor [Acidimicrobiales bacterium]
MTIRLLLADDHRMLRETMKRSMIDEGFDVIAEAADGLEAVTLTLEHRPDVVLMDVTMPEFDGVEATRRIHEADESIRIIMLTMHADEDVITAAIRAGAVGYLVKDCTFEEVAATVRAAVSGDTDVSANVAATMLAEAKDLAGGDDAVISRREIEVLQHIADGCSTPEVAEKLFISQKTVKNHLASIYAKLDARDRTQAVLQAVRMGIVRLY